MTTASSSSPESTAVTPSTPVLELIGISKTFGTVAALSDGAITVGPRQVVALVGDNGAGKSTLVKVMSGVLRPDGGQIRIDGEQVQFNGPQDARRHGIETVYQDLALAPDLDATANLFLGREVLHNGPGGIAKRLGVLDKKAMRTQAAEAFTRLGVGLRDPSNAVGTMSGGQRQGVAVGRAVLWASRVVLMDEPTAALGVVQTARVKALIESVREQGVSVVLISHNIPFVLDVADRVEVLRLGRRVASFDRSEVTAQKVLRAMTGLTDDEPGTPAV